MPPNFLGKKWSPKPQNYMFEPFQNFVPRAANRYGIAKEAKAAQVCHEFRAVLPEIFKDTPEIEQNIQPAHYKNGVLAINVTTPAWGQQVIMRKEKIIAEINKKAGEQVIKNLRTKLGL